jgi:hypothetical protein
MSPRAKRLFSLLLAVAVALIGAPWASASVSEYLDPLVTVIYESPNEELIGKSNPVDGWTVNAPFLSLDGWGRMFNSSMSVYVWLLNNLGLNGGAGPFRMGRTVSMRKGCVYRIEMAHSDILGLSSMQAVFSLNVNGISVYDFSVVSATYNLHSISYETEPLETDAQVEIELVLARITNSSWPAVNVTEFTIYEIEPPDPDYRDPLADLKPRDPEPLPELPTLPTPEEIIGLDGLAALQDFWSAFSGSNFGRLVIMGPVAFAFAVGYIAYIVRKKREV